MTDYLIPAHSGTFQGKRYVYFFVLLHNKSTAYIYVNFLK